MNFLSEKKYGVPSHNFVKKNVLCEKGDEITRFDGITWELCKRRKYFEISAKRKTHILLPILYVSMNIRLILF
jgi:hypothetical protein